MMRLPIACLALLLAGTSLAAEYPEVPPPPPPPPAAPLPPAPPPPPLDMALGMGGRALHGVDLTVEQRRQIRTRVEAAKKEGLSDAVERLHGSRRALERAVWNPDTGDAELGRLRGEVAEAEERLLTLRRRLAGEVLQLLSEEQRQQLARALDERP